MENNIPEKPNDTAINSPQIDQVSLKQQRNLLPLVLGGLVLLILGMGAGYYLATQKTQQTVSQIVPISGSNTTLEETNPTTGKSTPSLITAQLVKHENPFFTVEYPANWYTWSHGRGVSYEYFQINTIPEGEDELQASRYAYIYFDVQDLSYTDHDTLAEKRTSLEDENTQFAGIPYVITETIVDGVPAIMYEQTINESASHQSISYSRTVWLIKDNVKYIIDFHAFGKSNQLRDEAKSLYLKDFDKMISTVKLHIPDSIE